MLVGLKTVKASCSHDGFAHLASKISSPFLSLPWLPPSYPSTFNETLPLAGVVATVAAADAVGWDGEDDRRGIMNSSDDLQGAPLLPPMVLPRDGMYNYSNIRYLKRCWSWGWINISLFSTALFCPEIHQYFPFLFSGAGRGKRIWELTFANGWPGRAAVYSEFLNKIFLISIIL